MCTDLLCTPCRAWDYGAEQESSGPEAKQIIQQIRASTAGWRGRCCRTSDRDMPSGGVTEHLPREVVHT